MKNYYIADLEGTSGISRYASDFYNLVLKKDEYRYVSAQENIPDILSLVSSRDNVHIEIGIFQKNEIEILLRMLDSGYRNVSVTLHDAPLLKYPFREFKTGLLNKASKFYDLYLSNFRSSIGLLRKTKAVYVLSQRAYHALQTKYQLANVHYLPHIVNPADIELQPLENNNLLYFGFIGRNKGLEHALRVHQELLKKHPDVKFFVVGTALGKESAHLDDLKSKYTQNVVYLGYVPDEDLKQTFRQASFAMILFKEYKFYWPFSGSLLQSLKNGKIVLTNPVNAVPEIIEDGKTGFFLTGEVRKDAETLSSLFLNRTLLQTVQSTASRFVAHTFSEQEVAARLLA